MYKRTFSWGALLGTALALGCAGESTPPDDHAPSTAAPTSAPVEYRTGSGPSATAEAGAYAPRREGIREFSPDRSGSTRFPATIPAAGDFGENFLPSDPAQLPTPGGFFDAERKLARLGGSRAQSAPPVATESTAIAGAKNAIEAALPNLPDRSAGFSVTGDEVASPGGSYYEPFLPGSKANIWSQEGERVGAPAGLHPSAPMVNTPSSHSSITGPPGEPFPTPGGGHFERLRVDPALRLWGDEGPVPQPGGEFEFHPDAS